MYIQKQLFREEICELEEVERKYYYLSFVLFDFQPYQSYFKINEIAFKIQGEKKLRMTHCQIS